MTAHAAAISVAATIPGTSMTELLLTTKWIRPAQPGCHMMRVATRER
jgi:hypothetical protein